MSGILQALASIATAAATEATARTLRRIVWLAVAGLFILIGIAFGAAAGYEALAIAYGTLMAKLIIAGAFLLVGLGIWVVVAIRSNQRRRQTATSGNSTTAAVAFAIGLMSGLGRKR